MTIHASKGLEFPVVFIAGVEEGLIPHARSVEENNGDVEEERRLFYVAITRAQEKLIMTSCQKRKRRQFKNDDTYSGSPFDYTEVTPSRCNKAKSHKRDKRKSFMADFFVHD